LALWQATTRTMAMINKQLGNLFIFFSPINTFP